MQCFDLTPWQLTPCSVYEPRTLHLYKPPGRACHVGKLEMGCGRAKNGRVQGLPRFCWEPHSLSDFPWWPGLPVFSNPVLRCKKKTRMEENAAEEIG